MIHMETLLISKMDKEHILHLVQQWEDLIIVGETISKHKAGHQPGGLRGRIKRTKGDPVIFDADSFLRQKVIQKDLCTAMPGKAPLIRSKPELMDGYAWIKIDFIELYFEHYRIVTEKIRAIVNGHM